MRGPHRPVSPPVARQDDYVESLSQLQAALSVAARANPSIQCEVLVHKADSLSEDHKFDAQRDVHQQMNEDLEAAKLTVPLRVFLTSIYDHSLFEAMSKIVQKLIPQLPALQRSLDTLLSQSLGEQAFLLDVLSKLYVASDSSPVDMRLYELCSDVIDVVVDVGCIYGQGVAAGDAPAGEGTVPTWAAGALAEAETEDAAGPQSSSVITLSNNTVLHLQHIDRSTVVVCVMGERVQRKAGLLALNFNAFRDTVRCIVGA